MRSASPAIHAPSYLNFADKSEGCVTGWEEWLWESLYLRSHSRLRYLRSLPLRRRRTSCAKLSERARLVTVAPTLSPMPNGKPLSGASGAAEFASLAIAFRRIDYWLKPRRKAVCGLDQKAPLPTTYIARCRCRRRWTSGRRTRRRRVRQEPSSVSLRQPHAPISAGLFFWSARQPF